jgi:hypothetical protein
VKVVIVVVAVIRFATDLVLLYRLASVDSNRILVETYVAAVAAAAVAGAGAARSASAVEWIVSHMDSI